MYVTSCRALRGHSLIFLVLIGNGPHVTLPMGASFPMQLGSGLPTYS